MASGTVQLPSREAPTWAWKGNCGHWWGPDNGNMGPVTPLAWMGWCVECGKFTLVEDVVSTEPLARTPDLCPS